MNDRRLSLQYVQVSHVCPLICAVNRHRRDQPAGSRGLTLVFPAKVKQPSIGRDFGEQIIDPAIAHGRNA